MTAWWLSLSACAWIAQWVWPVIFGTRLINSAMHIDIGEYAVLNTFLHGTPPDFAPVTIQSAHIHFYLLQKLSPFFSI